MADNLRDQLVKLGVAHPEFRHHLRPLLKQARQRAGSHLYAADPDDLMRFAHAYASLGWAVQEQVDNLLAGTLEDLNPNAARLVREKLEGFNEELDRAMLEYDDWLSQG